ncbi:HutD family protein [Brevibacterium oceani]|uniref:HutD family protein n=1 Tax=Brevibacterium oceani TaxID=358099 RepID=UPI001B33F98C|nr:HutD family protein [Brevibacterium oceani]
MRVLTSFDDHDPVPWANGAGETTELVSLAESEHLTAHLRPWRLSIARLDHTGPFSALPGMARTFLPTAEVILTLDGRARRIPRLTPLDFRGDEEVVLVELSEPCFAVNLMVAEAGAGEALQMRGPGDAGPRRTLEEADVGQATAPADGLTDCPTEVGARPVFLLTLEAGPEHPRFTLFELTDSDAASDHLGGVLLH